MQNKGIYSNSISLLYLFKQKEGEKAITISLCMIVKNEEEVKRKHLIFKILLFQRGVRTCSLPFATINLVNKKQSMK
jgi:hypothetical protein